MTSRCDGVPNGPVRVGDPSFRTTKLFTSMLCSNIRPLGSVRCDPNKGEWALRSPVMKAFGREKM